MSERMPQPCDGWGFFVCDVSLDEFAGEVGLIGTEVEEPVTA